VAFFLKGFKMSYSTLYLEIKSEDKIEILNFAATEIRKIYNIAKVDINANDNEYTKFYFSEDHKELNIDIITDHHIWGWCKQNFDEIASKYKSGEELAHDLLVAVKKAKIVAEKEIRKKATSMLAFAGNWPSEGKGTVIDKALNAIKKIEIPGVPLS
jgi:hypothetical protein